MSWNSEFVSQWETFLNTVETRIRREIERNSHLDSGTANAIVEEEIAKWSKNNHYNGAWLGKLARQHPSQADKLQEGLKKIPIDKSTSFESKIPIVEVTIYVGFLLITLVIGQQLIVTMAIAVTTIPILTTRWTNRKKKRVDAYVEQIRDQLERMGERLKSIVVSADQLTQ